MAGAFAVTLFPLLLILAATNDVLTRSIPNVVTLAIALLFPPVAWAAGMDLGTISIHVAAALGVFAVAYLLFLRGYFGGGDAKLVTAASLWFGPWGLAPFLIQMAVAGAVLALAVLGWSLVKLDAELRASGLAQLMERLKLKVPYGYAIAAGALLALPASWMGSFNPA